MQYFMTTNEVHFGISNETIVPSNILLFSAIKQHICNNENPRP
jgi:hypothetical protein